MLREHIPSRAYARAIDEDEGASIAVLNKFQDITRDYEAITKEPTLPDFLDNITLLSGVTLDVSANEDENAVQILTAHRSKGKECPAVFVADIICRVCRSLTSPLRPLEITEIPGTLPRPLIVSRG